MSGAVLRAPRPGDLAWIVAEHARHYVLGEGFDPGFEAIVARRLGSAMAEPGTRLWIADMPQRGPVGSVLCCPEGDDARLRLFYVRSDMRGQGIGHRLVSALIEHARAAACQRVILTTHAEHAAACRLYARLGFERSSSVAALSFGRRLTVEHWALRL